jgi:hypothetical protein
MSSQRGLAAPDLSGAARLFGMRVRSGRGRCARADIVDGRRSGLASVLVQGSPWEWQVADGLMGKSRFEGDQ